MTVKSSHSGQRSHTMASSSDQPVTEAAGSSSDSQDQAVSKGQGLGEEKKERVRRRMLERLSGTAAHFAHQQRDAPDLSQQEKVDIAAEILYRNPATFLARFGKFLQSSDLAYFQDTDKDNYEVHFYLKQIQHRCAHSDVIVKNRRYAAMRELEEGGEYFSEEEMKRRQPLLYEEMVGQYLTEEEQQQQAAAAIDRSDLRFSTILMTHLDDVQEKALYNYQREKEECQEEEEEEDSEEEEGEDQQEMEDDDDEEAEDIPEISDVRATGIWRQQLREEFRAIMHEKFLSGEDQQFDYSKVDDNPDYDSLAAEAQDAEQKYFLSEEPVTVELDSSDSDKGSSKQVPVRMEEGEEDEEEDDYMMYEPSAELVAKSARFVKTGSWTDKKEGLDT